MDLIFKLIASLVIIMFLISEYMFFRWYILKKEVKINGWSKISILLTTLGTFIVATLYANFVDLYNLEVLDGFTPLQDLILGTYLTIIFATTLVYVLYKKRLNIDPLDDYITKYLGRNLLAKIFSIILLMAFLKLIFI